MANQFFKTTPQDNPKDRIEVEVGDSKQPDFKPQVKLMRWDNEVNFSVRYLGDEADNFYYDLDEGYEFELTLNSKPKSNALEFSVQSKELDFFYQPPLTQKEIDEGCERPDNVVGSYAVYHKTKGGVNRSDGMEYKVGKAFHLYRPEAEDADGNKVWCDLNIDGDSMTITIPQDFLDNAVYPVIVDPTFGYASIGSSFTFMFDDWIYGVVTTSIPEEGTLVSMSNYHDDSGGETDTYSMAVYRDSDDALMDFTEEGSLPGTDSWSTLDFPATPATISAGNYNLCIWVETGSTSNIRYDSVSGYNINRQYDNYDYNWPSTASLGSSVSTDQRFSIYATYTAGGADVQPSVNDSVTITESSTVKINNLVPSVSDTITLTESSTVYQDVDASSSESVTVTEDVEVTVNAAETIQTTENDAITITEDVTVELSSPEPGEADFKINIAGYTGVRVF